MAKRNFNRLRMPTGDALFYSGLGAVLCAAATTIYAVSGEAKQAHARSAVAHVFGKQTTQEKTLEQAVKRGLGSDVWVECTDTVDSNADVTGKNVGGTKLIVLRQQDCDALTTFAKDPVYKPDRDIHVGSAVKTLTHEESHVTNDSNESEAECYAIQKTGKFLVGLGASEQTAADIASENAAFHVPANKEYTPGKDCRRNGSQDLGLRVAGKDFFPGDPDPNEFLPTNPAEELPATTPPPEATPPEDLLWYNPEG